MLGVKFSALRMTRKAPTLTARKTRTPVKKHARIAATSAVLLVTIAGLGACGENEEDLQVTDAANEVREELAEAEAEFTGEPTTHERTITVAGREREYLVTTPPDVDDRYNLPLLFVFHGYKMSPQTIRKLTDFDDANAVVVYMKGVDTAWAPAPYAKTTGDEDLEFFDSVRQEMLDTYPVSPARVFAAGHSNGGGFAAFTACKRAHQLTGIATVSAAFYDKVYEGCAPIPTKQIDFHGTNDKVINYDGGTRHGAHYMPNEQVMAEAAKRNYCAPDPEVEPIIRPGEEFIWRHCDAELRHYRLDGSGHIWPGNDSDNGPGENTTDNFASKEILEFFGISGRDDLK